jgi:SpoVK/Ycf46/Vps4 family AAA+-type ATPase
MSADANPNTFRFYGRTLAPAVRLWMLRVLSPMGGVRNLVRQCGCEDEVLMALGIDPRGFDASPGPDERIAVLTPMLRKLWDDAEGRDDRDEVDIDLAVNVFRVGELVGLDELDRRLLEFAVSLRQVPLLETVTDLLGRSSVNQVLARTASILQAPIHDVQRALSPKSRLAQSGLMALDKDGSHDLMSSFDLLSRDFASAMVRADVDLFDLLRSRVSVAEMGSLTLDDYGHLGPQVELIRAYLSKAHEQRRAGVNILVYGPPGTGKTEFAKTLAAAIKVPLFEVNTVDSDDDPIRGTERLNAFRAGQRFLGGQGAMILFDEVDDVFETDGGSLARLFGMRAMHNKHKGAIVKVLEGNPVPTIWLTNDVGGIDPAFIRRFDWVLEMPVPPRSVRERLIQRHCGALVVEDAARRLAETEHLAPAVLTRAAAVVGVLKDDLDASAASDTLVELVGSTLKAQGHVLPRKYEASLVADAYDLAFVNADADLDALVRGIGGYGAARLLLFGVPGTGKTAFASHLARRIDKPLLVRRASNLLSKWVGESERKIAGVFEEAASSDSVLLIDEIDSFLQERGKAQASWEVSLVNELLTQMESFGGLLIATTNLLDSLDSAALRRFDLKVRFDALRAEQAWDLLRRHCALAGLTEPADDLYAPLQRMAGVVTPGDFAMVARRSRFQPLTDAAAWIEALKDECAIKPSAVRPIGFLSAIARRA